MAERAATSHRRLATKSTPWVNARVRWAHMGFFGEWAARQKFREQRPQRPAWPTLRRAVALHRPHAAMVLMLVGVIVFASLVGLGPALIIQRIIDNAFPSEGHAGDPAELNLLIFLMLVFVG